MCVHEVRRRLVTLLRQYPKSVQHSVGESVSLACNDELPYVNGLGHVQRIQKADGGESTLVYPKVLFRKRKLHQYDWLDTPFPVRLPGTVYKGMPSNAPECISGTDYYFEDGFRKVRPYYHVFDHVIPNDSFSHGRLRDVYSRLFPHRPERLLELKLQSGSLLHNLEQASGDEVLKQGDLISQISHFHEAPVLDLPIETLYEDEDALVVCKPPSYVAYPIARYRMNSLIFVLLREHGHKDVRVVHRLDRNTSGVFILGKGFLGTRKLQAALRSPGVHKEYLALVDGKFPPGQISCEEPLSWHAIVQMDSLKHLNSAKESKTLFERIEYDSGYDVSLVKCTPVTGRTHQIRLHLRHLGFTIVNDDLYNPLDERILTWNLLQDEINACIERLIESLARTRPSPAHQPPATRAASTDEEWLQSLRDRFESKSNSCYVCGLEEEYRRMYQSDANPLFMCLHSWRYTIDGRVFEAPMPAWVQDRTILQQVFDLRKRRGRVKG